MIYIKLKNKSYLKIVVIMLFCFFIITQTGQVVSAAGLLPGFYGSTSADITAPNINALPSLRNIVQGISSLEYIDDNQLIVHQDEENAIVDWDSFNIGVNAWTHFDQQNNSSWKVLNRIYDLDPSLIYGKLTADGHVYLINQNGIFFSSNSTINVGSLVASSLNISDEDFLAGTKSFVRENYIDPDSELDEYGVVSNHGTITVDDSGYIYLLGTCVENNGEISAYLGWVALAAGEEVDIYQEEENDSIKNVVSVQNGGDVYNYEDGIIAADLGLAGMYGKNVTQNGTLRSITAVKKAGTIELMASDTVVLGENSVTSTPVSESTEEVNASFPTLNSTITIDGLSDDAPLQVFENYGTIEAHSGLVDITAEERVYLASGSTIDVSGLWTTKSVSEKIIEVQLNSVELRDDYGQKGGILSGETVTISTFSGSSIGDISDYLSAEDKTAVERSLTGGEIYIDAGSGDIILMEDALLDVSGGGIEYTGGVVSTTSLLSASNIVYDIADAPEWETYVKILGEFEKIYERYGITETYTGLYYGGVAPLGNYVEGFVEGSDAGDIKLIASTVVLDGTIDGSVTQGEYQVYYSGIDDEDLYKLMGLMAPSGGTLKIGDGDTSGAYHSNDPVVQEIVIADNVETLSEDFSADDELPEEISGITYISSDLLNESGLSDISLYSRTGLTVEEGVDIDISADGSFTGAARSIDIEGTISVPGGTISLSLVSNITTEENDPSSDEENSEYVSLDTLGHERIFLASGSSLSVAGEQIDNSAYEDDADYETGITRGGSITLSDETVNGEGVVVTEGAVIDVSGGYEIDSDGDITGGDAGSLIIQGVTVVLDGDLMGYSIVGAEGGSVSIHAASITICSDYDVSQGILEVDDDISSELENRFVMDDDLFDDTGFANITLMALDSIEVESGVYLEPSSIKIANPADTDVSTEYGTTSTLASYNNSNLISVADEYLEGSSISLLSDQSFDGDVIHVVDTLTYSIDIEEGATISVFAGGSINIDAREFILEGTLYASAGDISVEAYDISLLSGSLISAEGCALSGSDSLMDGLPVNYEVLDGGSVALYSTDGDLYIESGATIDVSGSEIVTNYVYDDDGSITTMKLASDPGTISLTYSEKLTLEGDLVADKSIDELNGGTLIISSENINDSLNIGKNDLDITLFIDKGFDSITLESWNTVLFTSSFDLSVDRDFTINAPIISAADDVDVSIYSPWVVLTNDYNYYEGLFESEEGDASITLSSDYMDIEGYVTFSGFENVELSSNTDISLSDYFYSLTSGKVGSAGGLEQSGDLILRADRIYTETLVEFSIYSHNDITIYDNGDELDGTIYSAGSSLDITAENIYNYGDIYAPLGSITLTATADDGRVYLADGSTLSTYTDGYINYGLLDEDGIFWGLPTDAGVIDSENPVESAPSGSVVVEADEILTEEGSTIDVSGGGEVFAYTFLSSIEGSESPIGNSNQYVILLDNSVYSPGLTITIGENDVIPAGEYYVLTEEYAFVEGAIILTDLGTGYNPAEYTTTEEGYTVVTGNNSLAGSDYEELETSFYSVRLASDVLDEGYFAVNELTAGDGGDVELNGSTTIIEGDILGSPLSDEYSGGVLSLSGQNILLKSADNSYDYSLSSDFDFINGEIPDYLLNKLIITDESISGHGMGIIILGDEENTSSLTVESGVELEITSIELIASDEITLKENVSIAASTENGDGEISVYSPEGDLTIAENSLLYASDSISLETGSFDIDGELKTDGGTISLITDTIYFVSETDSDRSDKAGYITESLWEYIASSETVELGQGSEIIFKDSFDLSVSSNLIIDTSLVSAEDADITISSENITITNTGDASDVEAGNGSGTIGIQADSLCLSEGTVLFNGFSEIEITADSDVLIQGTGSLVTGDADLKIQAASMMSSALDTDDSYEVMDYSINAGSGEVVLSASGTSTSAPVTGGIFEIEADNIISSGILNMPGSQITMTATGSGSDKGVFLEEDSIIDASGDENSPGGSVTLVSEYGVVSLASGSLIDISAGEQGEAGSLEIVSPSNTAVIDGDIDGSSSVQGSGGSFYLDSATISDLGQIIDILAAGGIDNEIELRARQGNLLLEDSDTITANDVTLMADGEDGSGNIEIYGSIDTSGNEDASDIDVYANGILTLYSGSGISSASSGSDIMLSGVEGVVFESGAVISMGESDDSVDTVTFRSVRSGSELNISLNGTITGSEEVLAESVTVYDDDDHDGYIDDEISTWKSEIDTYMSDAASIRDTLFSNLNTDDGTSLYVTAGIEIISEGDLEIADEWNLESWRYDSDGDGTEESSGALILRAGGDLTISENIIDAPTDVDSLWSGTALSTWNISLISGADLSAANPMSTIITNSGNMVIEDGVLVYTEEGDIDFASGGDVTINLVNLNKISTPKLMGYNIGTYSGEINGDVGGTLTIDGGAIQSSSGDISIIVGEDLYLKRSSGYLGTIRSVGTPQSEDIDDYTNYETGGSITLYIKGEALGEPTADDAWDTFYEVVEEDEETGTITFWDEWSASYEGSNGKDVSQGIVALAGGDIYIRSGSDITLGVGTFGKGDLSIYSGGNLDGRFLITDGTGTLYSAGDFGMRDGMENQHIELFDAQCEVIAGGSILLGTVVNPSIANDEAVQKQSVWNLGYTIDTSISLTALTGDVVLSGETMFYDSSTAQGYRRRLLPATVSITAAGNIELDKIFIMAPSSTGQLSLSAGIGITGGDSNGGIYMSDYDPDEAYGLQTDDDSNASDVTKIITSLYTYHDADILHLNDYISVIISAGQDISNIKFVLPKSVEMIAEGDITDIYYSGQNVHSDDVSIISAGGDITFSSSLDTELLGIIHGGPGVLVVKAGNNIDLGTTDGIQLIGSQLNPYLEEDDNDLILLAGVDLNLTLAEYKEFFANITELGEIYSELLAEGEVEEAEEEVEKAREEYIDPLLEDNITGTGNIDMVDSQINITGNSGGIYLLAMGEINVGKTTFSESGSVESDSGIYTTAGGSVNIYSVGDVNVNESRVMTFSGGDIVVWSDEGDINAGRGSKTTVNASESEAVYDEETGTWSIEWEAPAVGSGIRTLTFDPDGLEGPEEAPEAGDVYLFAPEGEIDAGEAGISGSNVILGATEILNAQNISFSQGSVGVPVTTTSVNLGSLAGTSSLTDTAGMAEDATSSIATARDEAMQEAMKAMEDFIAKWLNVEVIGFYAEKDDEEN